jgi:hypothetical protein
MKVPTVARGVLNKLVTTVRINQAMGDPVNQIKRIQNRIKRTLQNREDDDGGCSDSSRDFQRMNGLTFEDRSVEELIRRTATVRNSSSITLTLVRSPALNLKK